MIRDEARVRTSVYVWFVDVWQWRQRRCTTVVRRQPPPIVDLLQQPSRRRLCTCSDRQPSTRRTTMLWAVRWSSMPPTDSTLTWLCTTSVLRLDESTSSTTTAADMIRYSRPIVRYLRGITVALSLSSPCSVYFVRRERPSFLEEKWMAQADVEMRWISGRKLHI